MRKNIIKYYKVILSFCLIFFCVPSTVFGGSKVDISSNKIISQNGGFYFKIPISWENYVSAERESAGEQPYVDKITFYYLPRDKGNSRQFIMNLYAYKGDVTLLSSDERIILKTTDYTFTTEYAGHNPYESVNDRIIFGRFLVELGSSDFISSKIVILNSNEDDRANTIIVNNQFVNNFLTVEYNNELHLPLREVSQKLGYSVTWNAKNKTVTLDNGKKIVKVDASGTTNQKVVYVGGSIYMPINFYMQKFNVNIEIDKKNNVKLKG